MPSAETDIHSRTDEMRLSARKATINFAAARRTTSTLRPIERGRDKNLQGFLFIYKTVARPCGIGRSFTQTVVDVNLFPACIKIVTAAAGPLGIGSTVTAICFGVGGTRRGLSAGKRCCF
jgi:hypothetical protein